MPIAKSLRIIKHSAISIFPSWVIFFPQPKNTLCGHLPNFPTLSENVILTFSFGLYPQVFSTQIEIVGIFIFPTFEESFELIHLR